MNKFLMKKFLVIAAVLAFASVLSAKSYEYRQLYKDPKIMAAGGAAVASGGSFSALFHNPAGLARIPKENGWEFQVLNIAAGVNKNIADLKDISDKKDDEAKVAEELEKHIGDRYNVSVSTVPISIAKMFDETAFGIGAVASGEVSAVVHQGFGAQGVVEAEALVVGGGVGGIAHNFDEFGIGGYPLNRLSVGIGAKVLRYGKLARSYSAQDIANDEFNKAEDEVEEGGSTVFDIGAIYDIYPNISVGASVMNMGGIAEDFIPATFNVGVSYVYRIEDQTFFNQLRISADYIDITRQYEDESFVKRTKVGAELNVWDGWLSTFALQAGLYQGAFTGGLSMRVSLVEIALATFAEEVGAYSGQEQDRRYMVSVGVTW
ncbi:MAG: conjugal transfer protein TraF [Helicobacteraceae bacterium]|jgi:hypothetical protein|nr:conjugal transfer protein TraF [Helicobacteraceae bacterium]